MRAKRLLATLLTCAPGLAAAQSEAPLSLEVEEEVEEEESPRWTDPEDGWFDLSSFIERPHGFLPVVVPITEPALGYGAIGAAAFLDPREEAGGEGWNRPNMTVAGGLWTENGSDGLFAANSSLWMDGGLQTLVGAAQMSFDLELQLRNPETLQVKGYMGVKFLSETFVWRRAKELPPKCGGA